VSADPTPRVEPARSPLPAAVLWDMDGTLVDTEPYWIECERELVGRYGHVWSDDDAHALVGNPLLVSAEILRERGHVPLPAAEIVELLLDGVVARVRAHVPFRPGARELLAALTGAGVPCALVTMSYRRFTDAVVEVLPPGTFAAVVAGDEVTHGKPHPEPYLTAAARLGVVPEECVAIEDSPTGVASAVAAGVPTLAVEHLVPISPGPRRTIVHSLETWTPDDLGKLTAG
jgi:HAD superfamily hydrolase (TIGR01509 family)